MNEYEPWKELKMTETGYYKRRYIESQQKLHKAELALEYIVIYCDDPDTKKTAADALHEIAKMEIEGIDV